MSLHACVSSDDQRGLPAALCSHADLVLHRLRAALRACEPPRLWAHVRYLPGWGQPWAPAQPAGWVRLS
eukprot:12657915-Alexandrium_andersonii.AAC.1